MVRCGLLVLGCLCWLASSQPARAEGRLLAAISIGGARPTGFLDAGYGPGPAAGVELAWREKPEIAVGLQGAKMGLGRDGGGTEYVTAFGLFGQGFLLPKAPVRRCVRLGLESYTATKNTLGRTRMNAGGGICVPFTDRFESWLLASYHDLFHGHGDVAGICDPGDASGTDSGILIDLIARAA